MNKNEIKDAILELISEKLVIFNIGSAEVNNDFDLVRSGLLDSMSFVDLVASLEERFDLEIDFEEAGERNITTIENLVQLFINTQHAG
ncbi:MAG: acyl carrier protein [Bacteroidota bacterium]